MHILLDPKGQISIGWTFRTPWNFHEHHTPFFTTPTLFFRNFRIFSREVWETFLIQQKKRCWPQINLKILCKYTLEHYASSSKDRPYILDSGGPASTSWTKNPHYSHNGRYILRLRRHLVKKLDTKPPTYNVRPVVVTAQLNTMYWNLQQTTSW